ncbi:hypothetical protein GCM10022243_34540 [Saccharothrix violaceirubra]|uniref:ATP/maltotriose-dependent transcriptional regulator MalT n=1 Tax=Saccharothrix violaceirubra TaxID=413306 RepID=A0A7W7T4P8_9PSEU|nr:AAA family ATPase [Saccharothrix violaceirubra]MBB4966505.1 ATP/maltotriose-dependent transcriptional regulator MalT [Saccharothrix violaceirubra]
MSLTNGAVPRERLFALLDKLVGDAVTLVHAPTGTGKSTLLATWADRCGPHVALVNVERRYGEPDVLRQAIHDASTRTRSCLVLDNADRLAGSPAAHLLTGLARDRGHGLVLAGRSSLPLRTWLRAHGGLAEIRAEDLVFTRQEATALLRAHHVHPSLDDFDALLARTGGHAATLRLAVTSLTERGTPTVPRPRDPARSPHSPVRTSHVLDDVESAPRGDSVTR